VPVECTGLSHTVLDIGGKIDSPPNIPDTVVPSNGIDDPSYLGFCTPKKTSHSSAVIPQFIIMREHSNSSIPAHSIVDAHLKMVPSQ
jgi:hypothetical protein